MADPTPLEIAQEIELLETFDAFVTEFDSFAGHLSAYSGQDLGVLSDDPTVLYELGQLRTLAKELSGTLADVDEVLGKGPGVADAVGQVVHGLDRLVDLATRTEALSGADRLRAMGDLLDNIESIATALTGLGGLNPVIGVFLGLYGGALRSAADTAEFLQGIQDEKLAVIRSKGELQPMPEPPPPDPAITAARARARARLDELYADMVAARARHDATELGAARDHCARKHRAALEEAARTASRFGFDAHVSGAHTGINRHSMAALESWLSQPDEAAAEAMAAAAGDPAATEVVADRVRQLLDAKAEVARRMADYLDCVDDVLAHGHGGAAPLAPAAIGAAAASAGRRGPLLVGAALVVLGIGAAAVALTGGGGDEQPESPVAATSPTSAAADASQAPVALTACEAAATEPHAMTASSPEIAAGAPIPEAYHPSTEAGLPSPPFAWSGLPEATTEIGIVVMGSQQTDHPVLTDPDPWRTDPEDRGPAYAMDRKWMVTGIPATANGLPALTYGSALDEGLTLYEHGASAYLEEYGDVSGWFLGPTTTSHTYLFTVFALCDPDHGAPNVGFPDWFVRHSIAQASFLATSG